MPDLLSDAAPLFLKQQRDQTLPPGPDPRPAGGGEGTLVRLLQKSSGERGQHRQEKVRGWA
jgi:hypothetical protein